MTEERLDRIENLLVELTAGLTNLTASFKSFQQEVNERFDRVEQRLERVGEQMFQVLNNNHEELVSNNKDQRSHLKLIYSTQRLHEQFLNQNERNIKKIVELVQKD